MTRLPRIVTLLGSAFLLAACGQLIGLSDFESVDGEGGQAGEDTAGRGGRAGGGAGGNAGSATAGTGGDRAGAGGSTGGSAGSGGTAGEPGTGGTGGSTGGTGSSEGGAAGDVSSGGEPGEAGAPGCRELTTFELLEIVPNLDEAPEFISILYPFAFLPNLGSSLGDEMGMEFYESAAESLDGSATGTFELGTDIDANFETCARCLRVWQDYGSSALQKIFFATSGTLTVDPSSLQMEEYAFFSLSDVTLVEVTIDEDNVSTPKENGECLHIASFALDRHPPPPEWTCEREYYWDGACDCGCGAPDPSCLTSYVSACEFCGIADSCSTDEMSCTDIDVDQNWTCIQPQPWTCSHLEYADGICDCGCGTADVDCVDSALATCESCHCNDPADTSCAAATVDPADTTLCLQ